MAIHDYTIQELADIRRNFDINEDVDDDAARRVAEMGGSNYGDVTPSEDLVEQNPLALTAAATDLEFTKTTGFRGILQVITDRIEFFTLKSKNLKLSSDERSAYRDMALGVEQTQLAIAEFVNERRLRLQNASVEERKSLGANAKAKIARLTAGVPVPDAVSDAPSGWVDDSEVPQPKPFDKRDDIMNPDADSVFLDGVKFIQRKAN